MLLVICVSVSLLTEFTSNVATAAMILPVIGHISVSMGQNPLLLMFPAAISCSFAFCLPVATPSNAIAFSSGRLKMLDMVSTGVVLNTVGILVLAVWTIVMGYPILGITLNEVPTWAKQA
jgi:sodium-dependent dicarboxylate transporter 2/3/5